VLPLSAAAQEKVRRVGLLTNGSRTAASGAQTTWRGEILQVLAQNGFDAGRNLELVERYSEGRGDRLPPLAREIGAAGVDVFVAVADGSLSAALAATEGQATPIVMVIGDDPVATGLVAGLARPGGRITGITYQTVERAVSGISRRTRARAGPRRWRARPPRFTST
jgi:putative ABC transport system substrate-binding protein